MLSSGLMVSGQPRERYGETERGQRVDQRLIEKKLRGELGEHVNVDDPAAVPAGHDGLEGDRPA